ncbi:MAG: hypothetical protein GXO90_09360 [FCB group bacterium]|nr:hypothetical protein [FCB group bacterium]
MKNKLFFLGALVGSLLIMNCSEPDYPENIYNPDAEALPDPVITSVSPSDSAFAGIGIVTLTGQNFSDRLDQNLVYFNGTKGDIQTASTTELVVKAPNLIADSVKIQVAVIGAYQFADYNNYKLYPPVIEWGNFDHFFALYGMAMDTSNNLYVSHSDDRDILRVFSTGERDSLVYGTHSAFLKADAMRMGPDGELYIARRYKKIYKIQAGGGSASAWMSLPGNVKAYDLDFDQYGNLYTGGRKNELYRVNVLSGESAFSAVAEYPTDVHVNAIRVFDGYVYIIGDYIGTDTTVIQDGIWRNQIQDASTLGTTELVIDWSTAMGPDAPILNGITFAQDGTMILSCDNVAALYSIDPPYSDQEIAPIYTEVLDPPATKITWGTGNYLFVNSRSSDDTKKRIFRIDMVKPGAPYYGRTF